MKIGRLSFAALFLLLSATESLAQRGTARLDVVVSSHSTGDPLPGVRVSIDELKIGGVTSDRGVLALEGIPAGTYVVRIQSLGYRTELVAAEFTPGARVEAEVDLLWEAIELTDLTIRGKRLEHALSTVGFNDREASTGGTFLTSTAWDATPGVGLLSVLERVPGIRIAKFRTRWGSYASRIYSGRSRVTLSGGGRLCWSRIYVDGTPQYDSDESPVDLSTFRADEIAAVEVYRGPAETPPLFSSTGSACGVVLLWTKSRLGLEPRGPKLENSRDRRLDMDPPVPTPVIPHS